MTLAMSEEAYWEMQDEMTSFPYGGYGNAMAQEAAEHHNQGLLCPFSCGVCEGRMEAENAEYEAQAEWDALTPAQQASRTAQTKMFLATYAFRERLRRFDKPLRHQRHLYLDAWGMETETPPF